MRKKLLKIFFLFTIALSAILVLSYFLNAQYVSAAGSSTYYYETDTSYDDDLYICQENASTSATGNNCWIQNGYLSSAANTYQFVQNFTPATVPDQYIEVNTCSTNNSQATINNSSNVVEQSITVDNYQKATNALQSSPLSCKSKSTNQTVNANLNITGITTLLVSETETIGPATVNLENMSGDILQTIQTNSDPDGGQSNSDQLTTSQNNPPGFQNIAPGDYKVCTPDLNPVPVCADITTADFVNTITVTLTGSGIASLFHSTSGSGQPTCQSSGGPLSWLTCAVIDGISSLETSIEGVVQDYLTTPAIDLNPSDCQSGDTSQNYTSCIYDVWSGFRLYGDIVLVLAVLAAIIVEAAGGGVIEAYSVRRLLPRVLLAAILLNLSIYLMAGMVDITNILGKGIFGLLTVPFKETNTYHINITAGAGNLFGTGTLFAVLGGATGIWALVSHGGLGDAVGFLVLFVGIPAVLAVLGVLLTIFFRTVLIVVLLMVSPVAFALYCFPNTEQYFRKWWNLFFKTLMVYPIVMVVFAMCDLGAVIVSSFTYGSEQWVGDLLSIVGVTAPLFLIPFAFKMSGGIIGTVQGAISDYGHKATEIVKGNPNNPESLRNKSRRRMMEQATRAQSGLIGSRDYRKRPLRRAISKAADVFGNADARIAQYNKAAAERRDTLTNFGNDDLIFAGAGYSVKSGQHYGAGSTDFSGAALNPGDTNTGDTRYFSSKGKEITSQLYDKGKSLYGGSQHDITQGLGYTIYKAQTDKDVTAMQAAFNKNAEQGNWTKEMIDGNWLGATYPYKGVFGSVRYSTPSRDAAGNVTNADVRTDIGSYRSMIKDMHKTRQAFRLSEIRDQDWRVMLDRQHELEVQLQSKPDDMETARDLAMTYEIFDAASQKMRAAMPSGEGAGADVDTISAGGATPAAQPIIVDAVNNRTFKLDTDSGTLNKRLTHKGHGTVTTGFRTEGPGIT